MAEEVKQIIGIDVSGAIAAVTALEKKLAGFGTKLSLLSKKMKSFNNAANKAFKFGNAGKDIDKVKRSVDALGRSASQLKALKGFKDIFKGIAPTGGGPAESLKQIPEVTAKATTALGKLSQAAKRFGTTSASSFGKATSTVQSMGKATIAALKPMTIGFQTLGRIISTQLIIRGISAIGQAFSSAVGGAIEFQLQMSEIQSISQGAFSGFEKAASDVRGISDAFNTPLGEAGEGLYQIISNQIKGAANQVDVLKQSAILAKVGVAELGSTVELVTGTINAFQLAHSDAARVSAVFFETVRLGKTRISELNQSFGQVATLASEAGVRFEELAGAFATVTVNGISTAQAQTQLKGVINALLKPTKEMTEALNKAGFASGQAALKGIGFAGVMRLLQDATGGSAAKLAKLIPRVRGLAAGMILGRNETKQLTEAIAAMDAAASDLAAQKFELRLETNAEQVQTLLNKLKNTMVVDVGQAILKVIAQFLEWTQVGEGLNNILKSLADAMPIIAVAIGSIGIAAGLALLTLVPFGAILGGIVALLASPAIALAAGIAAVGAAGAVAVIGMNVAENHAKGSFGRVVAAAEAAAAKEVAAERKLRAQIIGIREKRSRETQTIVAKAIAEERAAISELTVAYAVENDKRLKDIQTTMSGIGKLNADLLDNLKSEREGATEAAISGEKKVGTLQAQLADNQFNFANKQKSARTQALNAEKRAADLGQQAATALASARTDEQRQAANALAQRAAGFQQQAAAAAGQTKDLGLINRIQQSGVQLQQQAISATQQQVALQKKIAADIAKVEKVEQARVAKLQAGIRKVTEIADKLKFGEPGDRKKLIKDLQKATAEVRKLSKPASGSKTLGETLALEKFISDSKNFEQSQKQKGISISGTINASDFVKMEEEFVKALTAGYDRAVAAFQAAGFTIDVKLDAENLKLIQGGGAEAIGALDNLADDVTTQAEAGRTQLQAAELQKRNSEDFSATLKGLKEGQASPINDTRDVLGVVASSVKGLAGTFIDSISEVAEFTGLKDETEKIGSGQGRVNAELVTQGAIDLVQTMSDINDIGPPSAEALAKIVTGLNSLIDLRNETVTKATFGGGNLNAIPQAGADDALQKAIDALEKLRGGEATELIDPNAPAKAAAVNQALTPIPGTLSAATTQASALRREIEGAVAAANKLTLGGGGAAANAAIGRFFPKYLAGGGFAARGSDKIPAMLSPGEFVINSRSTKKFYSQLQSMNAGQQPIYRQEGGPVTNVGDINVSVGSGKDATLTGRTIARTLRRELRRGSSSL